ncbi:uncharacterized protein LOC143251537 [Tachypleus tridentatus]|uniref:uncharacterized protein LOC143251537 n=1 Tax=Tachypleus tridentatus TaxID=6853 RepID=UPI003FD1BB12
MRSWKITTGFIFLYVLLGVVTSQLPDNTKASNKNATSISRLVPRFVIIRTITYTSFPHPLSLLERLHGKNNSVTLRPTQKPGKEILIFSTNTDVTPDPIKDGNFSASEDIQTLVSDKLVNDNVPAESRQIGVTLPQDKSYYEKERVKDYHNTQTYNDKPKKVEYSSYTSYDDDPEKHHHAHHRPKYRNSKSSTTRDQNVIPRIPRTSDQKDMIGPHSSNKRVEPPPSMPVFKIPSSLSVPKSFVDFDFKIPGEPKYLRDAYSGSSLSESYDTSNGHNIPFYRDFDYSDNYDFVLDKVRENAALPIPVPYSKMDRERSNPVVPPSVDLKESKYDKNGCRMVVKGLNSDKINNKQNKKLSSHPKGVVMLKECLHPEATGTHAKASEYNEPELLYRPFFYSKLPFKRRDRVSMDRNPHLESTVERHLDFEEPGHFQHDLESHLHNFPNVNDKRQHFPEPRKYERSRVSSSPDDIDDYETPLRGQDDKRRFVYRLNNQPEKTYNNQQSYRFHNSGKESSGYDKYQPFQEEDNYGKSQHAIAPTKSFEKKETMSDGISHGIPSLTVGLGQKYDIDDQENGNESGDLPELPTTDHYSAAEDKMNGEVERSERHEDPQKWYRDSDFGRHGNAQTGYETSHIGSGFGGHSRSGRPTPVNSASGRVNLAPKPGSSKVVIPVQDRYVVKTPVYRRASYDKQTPIQDGFGGIIPANIRDGYNRPIPGHKEPVYDHGAHGKENSDPSENFNKSFSYLRKYKNDKSPKSPEFYEEYSRGRFKSFSTDYDSKRDDKH